MRHANELKKERERNGTNQLIQLISTVEPLIETEHHQGGRSVDITTLYSQASYGTRNLFKKHVEQLGYKVNEYSRYNESSYSISW